MCDIIESIEAQGIELEHLQQAMKKSPGDPGGRWSAASITLLVLGVVEQVWAAQERDGPSSS